MEIIEIIDSSLGQVLGQAGLDIREGDGGQFSAAFIETCELSRTFCPGDYWFAAGQRDGLSVTYGLEPRLQQPAFTTNREGETCHGEKFR